MVTRRQTLKIIGSSLLMPAMNSSVVAGITGVKRSGRTTDPTCGSCATNSALQQIYANLLDSAPNLKIVSLPTRLVSSMRSARAGMSVQYVESATGNLFFGVKDIELKGSPSLIFTRYYSSGSVIDSGFGKGWVIGENEYFLISGSKMVLNTATGDSIDFIDGNNSGTYTAAQANFSKHQSITRLDSDTLSEIASLNLTKIYKKIGDAFFLNSYVYSDSGSTTFNRDSNGKINSIVVSPGNYRIDLTWSSDNQPHVLGLSDSANRQVKFGYTGGLLTQVDDVIGAKWTYGYDNEKLSSVVDPEGTTILSVQYSENGVSSTNTIAGSISYTFAKTPSGASSMSISSPGGRIATYEHNADGQFVTGLSATGATIMSATYDSNGRLSSVVRPKGTHKYQYDSAGRLILSAQGKRWKQWQYDGLGRLQTFSDPAGPTTYSYSDSPRVIYAQSPRRSRSYVAAYNSEGRIATIQNSAGRSKSFSFTPEGNLQAVSNQSGTLLRYQYDSAGFLSVENIGASYNARCVRNARGEILSWSDSNGRQFTFDRDLRGAITQISNIDGSWARAERDASGRIVRLVNSQGQSRAFTYADNGALETFTDAKNRTFSVNYDSLTGEAISMTQLNGSVSIVRSSNGNSIWTDAAATTGGSNTVVDDGWEDPIGGQGLLGSFSGFTAYAAKQIANSRGSKVPAALAAMLSSMDYSDDDDDDEGDDDDDSPPSEECSICESGGTTSCQNQQQAADQTAQEIYSDEIGDCTLEPEDEYAACAAGALSSLYANEYTATGVYNACIANIPNTCASVC